MADTSITPNETHSFTYDASYRVQSNGQGPRGTLTYTYNPDDRVATMAVQSGPTTSYAYYPDGSLNTITWSPVTGTFKYQYTPSGQYQSLTLPNGQQRLYSYDDQGRLTQIANVHPTAGNLATYAYGYDQDNATGQLTELGQRTSQTATVPSAGLTNALSKYSYDPLYQLTKADYPSGAPFGGESHAWAYDAIGNRLSSAVNATTMPST